MMVVSSVPGAELYVCWILKKKVVNDLVVTESNEFCGFWARFFFFQDYGVGGDSLLVTLELGKSPT